MDGRLVRTRLAAAVALAMAGVVLVAGPLGAQRAATMGAQVGVLDAAVTAAADLPRLYSLLVHWRGEMILERYYNGRQASRLANVKSVSKSIVSALVGVAIDRGLIAGVDQPVSAFFADLLESDEDTRKREITVEDLLTMRSGLETTSNRNYGAWVQSRDWVQFALRQPLSSPPGARMEYSTGNSHLLSAILTDVSGADTWQFAQEVLGTPLGMSLAKWPQDPQGIYFGGNDMLLTPRQMVTFGRLYLNAGRFAGRQIVPADWVDASLVPRARSRFSRQQYGYGWWIRTLAGHRAFYAWGFGGQYIYVVPDLDLVVVSTSSVSADSQRRGHRRTVDEIVEELIVEPIARLATGKPPA
jgi:CubicO group peptidase (beta-lactamase class C family)